MSVLIPFPFLALAPAGLFLLLYLRAKARALLIAAIGWFAYVPYEYAMMARILCTGECNIRIDLLLIYPLLIVLSVAGIIAFALRWRKAA